jgi:hypothetical protein
LEEDYRYGTDSHNYGDQEVPHLLEDRKFGGVILSDSEDPRTRNSYIKGQGKMDVSAQTEIVYSPTLCLFVLIEFLIDWMICAHIGQSTLLYKMYWFK